ncbi:MAG TPA: WD40 repeat domain-containing protein [Thermoanaerobaculia bacterium]|nr:WD40 repeat domain-containing protein [Thermoanaerobaculia bacterium]
MIWQTDGGAMIREFPLQEGALAFALDRHGETLAITERLGQEVSTRIVRVADGVALARIPRPANTLERDLQFSPSGKIVSLLGPSTIVWPWTEGTTTFIAPGERAPQQLFFHPTDEGLVAFQDPGLQIWRWRDWKAGAAPVWSTPADISLDRGAAAFSSDGEWIAASARSSVLVARWREARNPTVIPLHGESRVVAVENGKLAIGFHDGVAELRSMAEDTVTHVAHGGEVLAVAFTPGGAVHSVSESGAMTWQAAPVDSRLTTARVDDAAISHDGAIVVTVVSDAPQSRNHKLYVYRDGRELGPFTGGKFSSVAFDAEGGLLAGTRDDRLLRWKSVADLESGKPPDVVAQVTPSVSISPSGAYQAWITPAVRRKTASGRAEIVSSVVVAGPKDLRFELPHPVPAGVVVFGSDDMLVTAAGDGKIRVWRWRVDARRPAAVFTRRGTSFLAASRDGAWVAATGGDGPALIWSTSGPDRPVATFPSGMSMIGFDPSAASVLTADADGIARVWSPWRDAPVEIARFTAPPAVNVARFSADGRYLVTASRFDGVRRRLWNDDEIADVACQRLRDAGLARYGAICPGGP